MRIRVALAAAATLLLSLTAVSSAAADRAVPLKKPAPSWYTPQLHAQLVDAGAKGIKVAEERLNTECPGFQQRGVSANGCIVAPFGCTANFIFTDGANKYIGTARHCVEKVGDPVTMQVDTLTLAVVGTAVKITPGDGEPGEDFALIRLFPDVVSTWGVNPALPIGGPNGVYGDCAPQPVKYYGHGYGAAVAQGKPEGGLATNWRSDGYGWTGAGIFGDSGSGVVLADNRGAGNFTHIIVNLRDYPGSNLAGMRLTAILQFLGGGIQLVNADGSTTGSGAASCKSQTVPTGGGDPIRGTVREVERTVDDTAKDVDDTATDVEEQVNDVTESAGKVVGGKG